MRHVFTQLLNDEAGFIVSAELILIATVGVLSLVVGLSEVASAINHELEDVASAFGSLNQSFHFKGLRGGKAQWSGSQFNDNVDDCDGPNDIMFIAPMSEGSGMDTNVSD